jgi:acetaldehyde dehydrogenase
VVGGADRSKAIIVLNPADPPLMMTNTVYALVKNPDEQKIVESVNDIIREVQSYVPGYRLRVPPIVDGNKVTVIIEVEGAGDFLPSYSGNLDIINQAAVAVASKLAAKKLGGN